MSLPEKFRLWDGMFEGSLLCTGQRVYETKFSELEVGVQIVFLVRSFTLFGHIPKTSDKLWRAPAVIFASNLSA